MQWYNYLILVLACICCLIPIIVALVRYIMSAIENKDWGKLILLIASLMKEIDTKGISGLEKKKWVMETINTGMAAVHFKVNQEELDSLIDILCDISKNINK